MTNDWRPIAPDEVDVIRTIGRRPISAHNGQTSPVA